jgi:hypothetical protein
LTGGNDRRFSFCRRRLRVSGRPLANVLVELDNGLLVFGLFPFLLLVVLVVVVNCNAVVVAFIAGFVRCARRRRFFPRLNKMGGYTL